MRVDRLAEKQEGRSSLGGAGCHRRPDALAPPLAARTASALSDAPIDHHEADGLLGQVIGGLYARRRDEPEVGLGVILEALR